MIPRVRRGTVQRAKWVHKRYRHQSAQTFLYALGGKHVHTCARVTER